MPTISRGSLYWIAILLSAVLIAPVQVRSQQVSEAARDAVNRWLMSNCVVGEEGQLEAELRRFAEEAEPLFLQALEAGPDPALIEELERAADRRYEKRQGLLKEAEGLGLSESDLEAAREITRNEFVERAREDFIIRYRSQAVSGLGIVDGQRAREALGRLAEDEASPLQSSAQQALDRLQENNE